ncbi:ubiquinol-cytochrome c reductase iron-sulfur subunit [Ornithinimicrobium cerasi]|uniref:Cytochrome bc1 complex Rieske iron-sulfur subunit n=1 Tax=Ornithinimicrobium cerasi TaxID=2248773 RepID=A0A285VCK2_9MICO|nr:ubiquinol-cytochrome c reductase iron-sulfur subunit [Ornithinimicrobium cerasi]SOC51687.1 menaquinol-cytochrome c reductase iron-sulfur subunit precursor [Ornithinimicrobium cerasi]
MSTHDNTPALVDDAQDRFANPGLPPHVPRRADVDESAANRASVQVVALFTLSALASIAFLVAYFVIDPELRGSIIGIGEVNLFHVVLGLTMGVSLLGIGLGAVHWAKTLMPDEEMVEQRHSLRSSDEDRQEVARQLSYGWRGSQLNRRTAILGSAGGALGLFALPLVVPVVAGLGPRPRDELYTTNWEPGLRLMIDPSGAPIRAADVTQGSVFHVMPEGWVGDEAFEVHGAEEAMASKSKDQVILVKLDPSIINSQKQRDWGYEGIVAYSKVCTHVGCPVALYEQQTHHLLCPCHQSTFDMTEDCKVIFGPAKRPLPQLPISVDDEGYLVAIDGFREPIGPSFFERERPGLLMEDES